MARGGPSDRTRKIRGVQTWSEAVFDNGGEGQRPGIRKFIKKEWQTKRQDPQS